MGTSNDGEAKASSEPWMLYLEDDLQYFEKGSVDEDATITIRDVLAANSSTEALIKEAALRLDKYGTSIRLSYDPMESIVHVARLIPYKNERQDRLIQLLDAVLKEPQTGSDYKKSLSVFLEKDWNGVFPTMRSTIDNEENRAILRQKCHEWLNYSAFKARTLAAGICADYDDWSFKAPAKDIHIGLRLRDDIQGGDVFSNCTLMVAAQYILIAGKEIRSQHEGQSQGWVQAHWKLWADRFHEASFWEGIEAETKLAAKQAHEKMVALWPELFPSSRDQASREVEEGAEVSN